MSRSTRATRTIIRTVKDRSNPYVVLDKTVFVDEELSWKAKGLMGYFLTRPDDWEISINDLVQRSTDGRDAVYSGLRELIKRGYVTRTAIRDTNGRILEWHYLVFERPQQTPASSLCTGVSPLTEKPEVALCNDESLLPAFPDLAKPDLENPTQLNNELNQLIKTTTAPAICAGALLPTKHWSPNGTVPPHEAPAPPAVVVYSASEVEEIRQRYRPVAGVDNLRPALVRKLLTKYGLEYVQEKLALWERWFREKLAAGEPVDPLRSCLDALHRDWVQGTVVARDRGEEEVRRTQELLQQLEEASRSAVPREVAARYLSEMKALLGSRRATDERVEKSEAPGAPCPEPQAEAPCQQHSPQSGAGSSSSPREVRAGWARDGP